jgi:ankyrin repeat protein
MKPFDPSLHAQALYAAQVYGDKDVEKLLWLVQDNIDYRLTNNPDVIAITEGSTLLHVVSARGYTTLVRILLAAGADVNAVSDFKSSALIWAAIFGHVETLELLINAGADLNHKNKSKRSALSFASGKDNLPAVKYLLECGAEIDSLTLIGATPAARQMIEAFTTSQNSVYSAANSVTMSAAGI